MESKLTFCICGGGSLAHATSGVLGSNNAIFVNVLTRQPRRWQSHIIVEHLEDSFLVGKLNRVSDNPADVIAGADVVIMSVPTYARAEVLKKIRPYLKEDAWVGSFPGFGGFAWVAHNILGSRQRIFGFQRVPFVCHRVEYGSRVKITGVRPKHFVASLPASGVNTIAGILRVSMNLSTVPMGNYLCICFSRSNSLLHPARIYSIFRDWGPERGRVYSNQPLFYGDWDDEATRVFSELDREVQESCRRIPLDLAYALPILQHYEIAFLEDLTDRIRSIRALEGRMMPMLRVDEGWIPDINSYYFTEDIPYGLVIVKALTLLAGTVTPMMDRIILWGQKLLNEEYLCDGRLEGKDVAKLPIPQNYGIRDLDALVRFCSA